MSRKRAWAVGIGVPVSLYGIGVGIFAIKNHYTRLGYNNGQPQAEHFLSRVLLIVGLVLGTGLLALATWASRWLKRFLDRLEAEFEASIAHLPVAEQEYRRRQRELMKIMMAWSAYLMVHEGLKIHDRHARERREREQELRDIHELRRVQEQMAQEMRSHWK